MRIETDIGPGLTGYGSRGIDQPGARQPHRYTPERHAFAFEEGELPNADRPLDSSVEASTAEGGQVLLRVGLDRGPGTVAWRAREQLCRAVSSARSAGYVNDPGLDPQLLDHRRWRAVARSAQWRRKLRTSTNAPID